MHGRRGVLLAGAVALALAAGGWLAWDSRRGAAPERGADAYATARVVALNAQLAQVATPYRLLVGDSQAERLYLPELCGTPVVNAGSGGARAATVRRIAEALVLPRPPEAVVVMIGTNDLRRSRDPAATASRETFRLEVRALLEGLAQRSPAVYAAPVPPIDPLQATASDAGQVGPYSAIVAEECARSGCRPADVFPASAALSPDGVHLATADMVGPDGVAARLARAACPR